MLGGVAWERIADRPSPRARGRSTQIDGGRPLGDRAVLAGPTTDARGRAVLRVPCRRPSRRPDRAHRHHRRRRAAPRPGNRGAAGRSTATSCVYVDVGGDAIADGAEPGLASPLCDAVMLAAGLELGGRLTASSPPDRRRLRRRARRPTRSRPDRRPRPRRRLDRQLGASPPADRRRARARRRRLPDRGEHAGRPLRARRARRRRDPRRAADGPAEPARRADLHLRPRGRGAPGAAAGRRRRRRDDLDQAHGR